MKKRAFILLTISLLFATAKAQLGDKNVTQQIKSTHTPGTPCKDCEVGGDNQKKSISPPIQNGHESISISYSNTTCGLNYVTGTVVLEQRVSTPTIGVVQPAPIVISGIPSGAVILKSFLYAVVLGNGGAITSTLKNPGGTSSNFPMAIIGTDGSPCWSSAGYDSSYSYRADVTSIVTGNGTYTISGLPVDPTNIGTNDVEGATLVIIYSNPAAGYTGTIIIADGGQVSSGLPISGTISGFNVLANSTYGNSFMLIADLQQINITTVTINGTVNNFPTLSDAWWNCIPMPSTTFTAGETSCTYSVTNPSDCYYVEAIGLYYQDSLPNTLPTSNIVQCNTFTTDTINAGSGFVSYLWSTGATTQTISISSPGSYWVQATNSNGCTVIDTIKASVINPATIKVLKDTVVCTSSGTYVANATYNGATGYLWNDGTTNPIKTFTISGTYTVNIDFPDGCVVTDSFRLTLYTKPTVHLGDDTVICGSLTSPIILNAGAGSGYTYLWSTGATTQTISVTSGGTYSVDVVSASGCGQTDSINIFVIGTNNHYVFDTSLCNLSSFPLLLQAQEIPGNNNYYYWSSGISGYGDSTSYVYYPGTYYLYIYVDGFSCVITDTFNVTLDTVHITNIVECNTFSPDTVSAGTGFVTYLWSTGATTYSTVINSVGTYWIKVTSGGGCTAVDTFKASVINPDTIHPLKDTTFCSPYYSYYFANAYVNGAQSYLWSNFYTTSSQYLYGSGIYWVNITFSGGCVVKDTFNLNMNIAPYVYLGYDQTYCNTITTPIILNAGYGAGYTYSWSPTGATTETISVSDSGGSYTVDVTSPAGCSTIDSITITVLNIPPGHQIDTSICNLSSLPVLLTAPTFTGTIDDYYYWSDGGYGLTDYDYTTGPLYLTIYVNDFSCVITDTFNVAIDTTKPHISDIVYCNIPKPDTVSAGLGYAHYLWSTGVTTYTTQINSVGNYSVQVTSTSGCLFTDTFSVKALNIPIQPTIDTFICSLTNFPIMLNSPIIAGSGNSYLWNNGASGTSDVITLPGSYYVDISVHGGVCSIRDSFDVVLDTTRPHINNILYCNHIKADTVSAGNFASYLWSSGVTTNSIVINNTGTFWVKVTSSVGCVFRDTFLVSYNTINKPIIPDVANCNTSTATNVLNAGTGYTSYNWSTGSISQSITVSAPGSYWVTVKDIAGCSITDTVKVADYTSPVINILRDTSVCGKASITINATYPNTASYLWSDGYTAPIHTLNTGGIYWVVYTLTTTCVASDTFNINIKNVKSVDSIPNIVTPNNDNRNDYIDFGIFQFPNMKLEIYNRWGTKIEESNDPNYIWRPTCEDGTYFYVIAYTPDCDVSAKTNTLKGFFTILR
jgi:gliding motility-associated-like protein